jgi:AhpD family alkylhydroperoxidase
MHERVNYLDVAPGVGKAMVGLVSYLAQWGLERSLLRLVDFRVSQINGCACCLDMHSKYLRAEGETEQRLYVLDAWRESPFYSAVSAPRSPGPKP